MSLLFLKALSHITKVYVTSQAAFPNGPQLGPKLGPNLAQLGPNWGPTGAQLGPNWGPYGMLRGLHVEFLKKRPCRPVEFQGPRPSGWQQRRQGRSPPGLTAPGHPAMSGINGPFTWSCSRLTGSSSAAQITLLPPQAYKTRGA